MGKMKTDWTTYAVHDENNVKGFFGDYRFLSNYELCDVYLDGDRYGSSEAAYMASKSSDPRVREMFFGITPLEAKQLGRTLQLSADWHDVRYDRMSAVVFDKFYRNIHLREKLLATGNKYLEETNHWNDVYWGVNLEGKGENSLGRILMAVRRFWQEKDKDKLKVTKLF